MKEKRKYPRIHINADVSLTVEGKSKYFKMLDISKGGISFISERVISDGAKINLDVHDGEHIALTVLEGDFQWLCEDSAIAGYKVRCQFTPDLNNEKWTHVQDYFHELELVKK